MLVETHNVPEDHANQSVARARGILIAILNTFSDEDLTTLMTDEHLYNAVEAADNQLAQTQQAFMEILAARPDPIGPDAAERLIATHREAFDALKPAILCADQKKPPRGARHEVERLWKIENASQDALLEHVPASLAEVRRLAEYHIEHVKGGHLKEEGLLMFLQSLAKAA